MKVKIIEAQFLCMCMCKFFYLNDINFYGFVDETSETGQSKIFLISKELTLKSLT